MQPQQQRIQPWIIAAVRAGLADLGEPQVMAAAGRVLFEEDMAGALVRDLSGAWSGRGYARTGNSPLEAGIRGVRKPYTVWTRAGTPRACSSLRMSPGSLVRNEVGVRCYQRYVRVDDIRGA